MNELEANIKRARAGAQVGYMDNDDQTDRSDSDDNTDDDNEDG
jgi:hypothetical protein